MATFLGSLQLSLSKFDRKILSSENKNIVKHIEICNITKQINYIDEIKYAMIKHMDWNSPL